MADPSENISSCFVALQKSIECVICLDILNSPVVTRCQHHFCADCIQEAMKGRSSFSCPLCKYAITSRSLRPDTALSKMVTAIKAVLSAGNKEIVGTEAAMLTFSTFKKSLQENENNSCAKDKRPGFRGLFQTPKHSKQKSSPKLPVETDGNTSMKSIDLLDIVDNISKRPMLKTPPFGGSSTSTDSRNIPSVCLKKGSAEKNEAENEKCCDTNTTDDPFHFPITQTQPISATKSSKKSTRKSVSSKKSPLEVRKSKRLQKSSRTPNTKGEVEKSPMDHRLIECIQQTKNHSLTVEPTNNNKDTTPLNNNNVIPLPKSKQKTLSRKAPKKNLSMPTEEPTNINKDKTASHNNSVTPSLKSKQKTLSRKAPKKNLSKAKIKISSTESGEVGNEAPEEKQRTEEEQENNLLCNEQTGISGNQHNADDKEETNNVITKLIEDHPKITRRLLNSDTSSNVSVTQEVVRKPSDDAIELPDVEEKVSMWLKGIEPTDEICFEQKTSEKETSEEAQIMDSELEEFVSASQCYEQLPTIVVKRKKRKLPADLISSEELLDRQQQTEFFSGQKPKRQYSAMKKDVATSKSPMLENLKSSLKSLETIDVIPVESKPAPRRKSRNRKKETHIFDVPGLSQGVSPFTTPTKDPENKTTSVEITPDDVGSENNEPVTSCKVNDEKMIGTSKEEQPVKELEAVESANPSDTAFKIQSCVNKNTKSLKVDGINVENEATKVENQPICTSEKRKNPETNNDFATKLRPNKAASQVSTPQGAINEAAKIDVSADIHHGESLKSIQKSLDKLAPHPFSPTAGVETNLQEKILQKTVVDLEDMPIVCVRETQDSVPPYYVETPHCGNSSSILHKTKDAKRPVGVKKQMENRQEKPVELGLFDFSEPSQPVSQPTEPTVVQSEKILETCRMVLRDLDESKCEDKTEDNRCSDADEETIQPPPGVGRVVDLTKVQKPSEATNTMKDINMSLSQMEDNKNNDTDEKVETLQQGKENENRLNLECKSPVYSLYACPSSHDGTCLRISDCDTNVIQNTEEFAPKTKPTKTTGKRRRRSRLTMPAKKPRVRIVDAPKIIAPEISRPSLSKNTPVKAKGHQIETIPASIVKDADDVQDNASSDGSDMTKMLCTSNGWGGTKLKIRILHRTKRKGTSSQSDSEMPEKSVGKESENNKSIIPKDSMNKDHVHISSSWPTTTRDVSVVLDKMDETLLPPLPRSKEVSAKVDKPVVESNMMKLVAQKKEETAPTVIPSSPLLFAPSQEKKNPITLPVDQLPTNDIDPKDIADSEVVCQSWCENQVNSPSCHECDESPDKQKATDNETTWHMEKIKQKSHVLLEHVNNFIKKLDEPDGEVSADVWNNIFELCKEIDVEINTSPPSSATPSPDIKCTAKKSKRKLSLSSEEDNGPVEIEKDIPPSINNANSPTHDSQNNNDHESDMEIDSSLPTILLKLRSKLRPVVQNSDSDITKCPAVTVLNEIANMVTSTAKPVCRSEDEADVEMFTSCHNDQQLEKIKSPVGEVVAGFGDISKIQKPIDAAKDSPESPDSHETSEFEDASVVAWVPKVEGDAVMATMDEQNAQRFTASEAAHATIDDSQPDITTSQVPSPTPPPVISQTHCPDLTNVSELLQKISEFTEDLNKEPEEEIIQKPSSGSQTEKPSSENQIDSVKVAAPSSTLPKPQHLETIDKPTEFPQPPTSEVRHILSPLNTSSISISTADTSIASLDGRRIGLMTSGIRGKAAEIVKKFAKRCRGSFYDTFVLDKVTHVIVKTDQLRCDRTLKFIQGIASKIWVVSYLWVVNSLKRKKILPEEEFEVIGDNMDVDDETSLHGPRRSRLSSPDYRLLSGFAVCYIPPFALFTSEQLKELLQLLGATVLTKPDDFSICNRKLKRILALDANAYTDSLPNYAGLATRHNAEAVSCDWVFECVASFRVQPTNLFPVEESESQETAE